MLDDSKHAGRDEPRCAHDASVARELADLDGRTRAAHLDAASGALGLDDVLPRGAVACVDENLDKISLCHDLLIPCSN
jgi:hypothetical protein